MPDQPYYPDTVKMEATPESLRYGASILPEWPLLVGLLKECADRIEDLEAALAYAEWRQEGMAILFAEQRPPSL